MPKTITDNQVRGELGEALVKAKVLALGHTFQASGRLETGIDGTIEFRNPQTGQMTGKTIAVQIKTKEQGNYLSESDAGFEYLLRSEDIEYWRQCNLPVVLVLYRRSDDSYFWKSVTDCLGCGERRLAFDKATDRLDESAMDRLAMLAVERGRLGSFVPPMRKGERAHLNLMRISLPDEIFVAESPFASGRDAVPDFLQADGQHFDWVIRGRRFVSFRDPRNSPSEAIVDPSTVEAVDTELVADSDDPDDELVMIELLRRAMVEQFAADLAYERKSRVFYFKAQEPYATRTYHYRSLKEETCATVVQAYQFTRGKRTGQVRYMRHHAFMPRFERIGSEWFVSVSPTFVFTEDGFRMHRFASELLAGKKRKDRNGSIRGQLFLFRFLLSGARLSCDAVPMLFPINTEELIQPLLGFEPVDPIIMPVAVPEDAWAASDPNASRMKSESDQALLEVVR